MGDNANNMAIVTKGKLERNIEHEGVSLVKVSISYPVISGLSSAAQNRINRYYTYASNRLLKRSEKEIYKFALETYNAMGIGFTPFSIAMAYTVTKNSDGVLSLYMDVYEYMGGAHGATTRYGDTWSLVSGYPVSISALFPKGAKYKEMILSYVLEKAQGQTNGEMYYEDYQRLIRKNFSEDNFHLTGEGLAVFYQEYSIAPYAAGIIVFIMPYDEEKGPHISHFA